MKDKRCVNIKMECCYRWTNHVVEQGLFGSVPNKPNLRALPMCGSTPCNKKIENMLQELLDR